MVPFGGGGFGVYMYHDHGVVTVGMSWYPLEVVDLVCTCTMTTV